MGFVFMKIQKTTDLEKEDIKKDDLYNETQKHKNDVFRIMSLFAFELMETGYKHDWTKEAYFDDFYNDTVERKSNRNFKERKWYKIHTEKERHHLHAKVPEDIDLVDVIEYISDSVAAGLSRSGRVEKKYLEISGEALKKAYWNTIDKLIEELEVENE